MNTFFLYQIDPNMSNSRVITPEKDSEILENWDSRSSKYVASENKVIHHMKIMMLVVQLANILPSIQSIVCYTYKF